MKASYLIEKLNRLTSGTIYRDVDDLHNLLNEGALIEKRSFIPQFFA